MERWNFCVIFRLKRNLSRKLLRTVVVLFFWASAYYINDSLWNVNWAFVLSPPSLSVVIGLMYANLFGVHIGSLEVREERHQEIGAARFGRRNGTGHFELRRFRSDPYRRPKWAHGAAGQSRKSWTSRLGHPRLHLHAVQRRIGNGFRPGILFNLRLSRSHRGKYKYLGHIFWFPFTN